MNATLEDVLRKRKEENKCFICGGDTKKEETTTLNHCLFEDVLVHIKHIRIGDIYENK